MLKLKIGNISVSADNDTNIPVVLRSPVFRTGDDKIPGSFIFDFSLPYTNELKTELQFPHRPARKGKPVVDKPFELHFGPLHYTGTASIVKASETHIEVSMPVDSGDLAKELKNKFLNDIGITETVNYYPKLCFSYYPVNVDLFYEEEALFVKNIPLQPVATPIDTLSMLNTSTYEWKAPYNGSFNVKVIINSKFGTITMLGSTFPAGNVRAFDMHKNGTRIYAEAIEADSYSHVAQYSFQKDDIITFFLACDSVEAYSFHYLSIAIKLGTTITIDDNTFPFTDEIAGSYPDYNYTVFPVNNPSVMSNLPESLYRIDIANIIENHKELLPYLNYYAAGKFPYVVVGIKEEIYQAVLNLFAPYPYLPFVVNKLFKHIGYNIVNNVFENNDLKKIVYFHNSFINNYFYDNAEVAINDFMPKQPLADFLKNVTNTLGIVFTVDSTRRNITFKFVNDIMLDQSAVDFSDGIVKIPEITFSTINGYKINFTPAQCDYLSKYVKSLEGLTIKGTVTILNQLSAITDQLINDCWYVSARHSWFVWNYDPEQGALNWVFHSFDFTLELKDTIENIEKEPYSVELNLNTVLMDYFDPILGNGDKTISAAMRDWHVPVQHIAGNFRQLPEAYKSEYFTALLNYLGMVNDSNSNPYPMGSNSVYNFAGSRIADLGLTLDGDYGLFEKKLKLFMQFITNSPGDYEFTKIMSPVQIANLNFLQWHNIHGVDYLIKEVRFNIFRDHISVPSFVAVRRNIS